LKGAAILLLALSGYQFIFEAAVPLVPVILANVLFVLSIFSRTQAQRVAVIAIALAVIIPLGAFRSYSRGETSLMIVLLNVPVFAAVAYVCAQTLLALARRRNVNSKAPE
ncbi:MAG: hypothetical protein OES38_12135, partial [Gammaproteobacteria bacterium]|nr:hypothetical protein [Gammaproteobacteria bacterium]